MVSEEVNRSLIVNHVGGYWNYEAEVMVLKLPNEQNLPEARKRDVFVPPAPDGQEKRLKRILDKWRGVESHFSWSMTDTTVKRSIIAWKCHSLTC